MPAARGEKIVRSVPRSRWSLSARPIEVIADLVVALMLGVAGRADGSAICCCPVRFQRLGRRRVVAGGSR